MTRLNKYYDMTNDGDLYPTYTRDSWEIPEAGTEIWCTGWSRGQTIKPAGDGCHVVVGFSVYHCDQLMDILKRQEADGHKWGIEGVTMKREQQISGRWTPVSIAPVLNLVKVEEQPGNCRDIYEDIKTKRLYSRHLNDRLKRGVYVNHWNTFTVEPDCPLKDGTEIRIGNDCFKIHRDKWSDWAIEQPVIK